VVVPLQALLLVQQQLQQEELPRLVPQSEVRVRRRVRRVQERALVDVARLPVQAEVPADWRQL